MILCWFIIDKRYSEWWNWKTKKKRSSWPFELRVRLESEKLKIRIIRFHSHIVEWTCCKLSKSQSRNFHRFLLSFKMKKNSIWCLFEERTALIDNQYHRNQTKNQDNAKHNEWFVKRHQLFTINHNAVDQKRERERERDTCLMTKTSFEWCSSNSWSGIDVLLLFSFVRCGFKNVKWSMRKINIFVFVSPWINDLSKIIWYWKNPHEATWLRS